MLDILHNHWKIPEASWPVNFCYFMIITFLTMSHVCNLKLGTWLIFFCKFKSVIITFKQTCSLTKAHRGRVSITVNCLSFLTDLHRPCFNRGQSLQSTPDLRLRCSGFLPGYLWWHKPGRWNWSSRARWPCHTLFNSSNAIGDTREQKEKSTSSKRKQSP